MTIGTPARRRWPNMVNAAKITTVLQLVNGLVQWYGLGMPATGLVVGGFKDVSRCFGTFLKDLKSYNDHYRAYESHCSD